MRILVFRDNFFGLTGFQFSKFRSLNILSSGSAFKLRLGKKRHSHARLTANMDCCRLQLTVPGASKIELVPNFDYPFGDGSGELGNLLDALRALSDTYDISSIIALLVCAIEEAKVPVDGNLDSMILAIQDITLANSISSGLRIVFSGWNRWIVAVDKKLFLAWLPNLEADANKQPMTSYWLLWMSDGNEWAVIVEGELKKSMKQGIAYTNFFKVPSTMKSEDVVLLLMDVY